MEDLVFREILNKYILEFRIKYIDKKIKSKNEDLYKSRREINKKIREKKEKLKECKDINEKIKILEEIEKLERDLNEINEKIRNNSKFEFDLREKLKTEKRRKEKAIRNYFKSIIEMKYDKLVTEPVDQSIENKDFAYACSLSLDSENEKTKPPMKVKPEGNMVKN